MLQQGAHPAQAGVGAGAGGLEPGTALEEDQWWPAQRVGPRARDLPGVDGDGGPTVGRPVPGPATVQGDGQAVVAGEQTSGGGRPGGGAQGCGHERTLDDRSRRACQTASSSHPGTPPLPVGVTASGPTEVPRGGGHPAPSGRDDLHRSWACLRGGAEASTRWPSQPAPGCTGWGSRSKRTTSTISDHSQCACVLGTQTASHSSSVLECACGTSTEALPSLAQQAACRACGHRVAGLTRPQVNVLLCR